MGIIAVIIYLVLSLVLLLVFLGIELAFISANRFSIELGKKKGTSSGILWSRFSKNPESFTASFVVLSTLSFALFALSFSMLTDYLWTWVRQTLPDLPSNTIYYGKIISDILISGTIVVFLHYRTRAYFRYRNYTILSSSIVASIVRIFHGLIGGLAKLFLNLSEWILKYILNINLPAKKPSILKTDIDQFYSNNKHINEEETTDLNNEMFENALAIRDTKLRACLVPRKEIVRIKKSATIAEAKAMFIETKLSKLLVIEENIDSIVGYIHQLDLFTHPTSIEAILKPIPVVPDNMNATDLMNKFAEESKSIAWVVDEFGGTAGIVTMEDLLEEIFGDIRDEHDEEAEFIEQQISEDEFILSGRLELDYIADKFNIVFSEDTISETLSGYIIELNENIPQEKDRVIIGRHEFNIVSVNGKMVETVKLKLL
jgi:CBS domain containing-hemolysin-like protein